MAWAMKPKMAASLFQRMPQLPTINTPTQRIPRLEFPEAIINGKASGYMWDGKSIEAAATTHLVKVNNHKLLILTACAGHHRERWLPLFERIESYAKSEGCKSIRIYGRKGWERVLKNYRVEHVILERQL